MKKSFLKYFLTGSIVVLALLISSNMFVPTEAVYAAENNKMKLWRACYEPPGPPDYNIEAVVRCCKDGGTEACTMLSCPPGTTASQYCTENPPSLPD